MTNLIDTSIFLQGRKGNRGNQGPMGSQVLLIGITSDAHLKLNLGSYVVNFSKGTREARKDLILKRFV